MKDVIVSREQTRWKVDSAVRRGSAYASAVGHRDMRQGIDDVVDGCQYQPKIVDGRG
jgi:hypothetical protein